MAKHKILLIDDETDFCKIIKLNLEQMGDFQVEIVNEGKKGFELAKKFKPDIIILDIVMPKISGLEVLKKIKTEPSTIAMPVVMLTAKEDNESQIKAAQLYDELYLVKPIEAAALKSKIEEILKRRGL
jgi:two-component system alkaline phosphatase synthesis response regulator PhoP